MRHQGAQSGSSREIFVGRSRLPSGTVKHAATKQVPPGRRDLPSAAAAERVIRMRFVVPQERFNPDAASGPRRREEMRNSAEAMQRKTVSASSPTSASSPSVFLVLRVRLRELRDSAVNPSDVRAAVPRTGTRKVCASAAPGRSRVRSCRRPEQARVALAKSARPRRAADALGMYRRKAVSTHSTPDHAYPMAWPRRGQPIPDPTISAERTTLAT